MQTAQSHLSHKEVKTNNKYAETGITSYHERLQPYSTLYICWTYFHVTSHLKRHKTQAFPNPLHIKLCFTSKKNLPEFFVHHDILAKVDKHPFCELWNNFIVPFKVLQLLGDNRNFHPCLVGIDQCHPMRYWKPSHSQPF